MPDLLRWLRGLVLDQSPCKIYGVVVGEGLVWGNLWGRPKRKQYSSSTIRNAEDTDRFGAASMGPLSFSSHK